MLIFVDIILKERRRKVKLRVFSSRLRFADKIEERNKDWTKVLRRKFVSHFFEAWLLFIVTLFFEAFIYCHTFFEAFIYCHTFFEAFVYFHTFLKLLFIVTLVPGQGIYWSRYVFKCIQILHPKHENSTHFMI